MSRADSIAAFERLIEAKERLTRRAAPGLGALQDFLERGLAAFLNLPRPIEVLALIERRETRLMQAWLAGGAIAAEEPLPGARGTA